MSSSKGAHGTAGKGGPSGESGRAHAERSCRPGPPGPDFLVQTPLPASRNPSCGVWGRAAPVEGRWSKPTLRGVGGVGRHGRGARGWRVCLCLSMQFFIFVKINSRSLAHRGVYSLPGSHISRTSGASSGPGAVATTLPPPPATTSPACLQNLVHGSQNCLLAAPCARTIRRSPAAHWLKCGCAAVGCLAEPVPLLQSLPIPHAESLWGVSDGGQCPPVHLPMSSRPSRVTSTRLPWPQQSCPGWPTGSLQT
ncbi:PREDICTED: LOW QUALITY PROTEIN: uncharacterized protein LOC105854334 [Condylura cristata]|uniref:LOW QUALITY PROTEIN: uncharacterized protein LOC105854334 n=1 Tax=Condylura cristata TaxID=143302 RepID=UPI00064334E1|nr:PREDICTED: LOW QUALITY PROTEIN: uncharacterized protein LOC105854334 [Condylura cristata]